MKKLFLIITLLISVYSYAHAQFVVGGHLAPVFPMGKFSDAVDVGFGLGAEAKYMLSENFAVGVSISWYSFGNNASSVYKWNITPFLLSAEYLFPQSSGLAPYVGVGLGPYRVATRIDRFSVASNDFGIAPIVGMLYPLNEQIDINANLKFNFMFSEGVTNIFFPLNVGILMKL